MLPGYNLLLTCLVVNILRKFTAVRVLDNDQIREQQTFYIRCTRCKADDVQIEIARDWDVVSVHIVSFKG